MSVLCMERVRISTQDTKNIDSAPANRYNINALGISSMEGLKPRKRRDGVKLARTNCKNLLTYPLS